MERIIAILAVLYLVYYIMHTTTIVIPAYNEAQRIGATLGAYLEYFDQHVVLLVILNGCTDATEEIVRQWQKQYPARLHYRVYPGAIGKGAAVREGFQFATGEYIGFVDADNATVPSEFEKLLLPVYDHQCDGAIASRYISGSEIVDRVSWLRRLAGRVYRLLVRLLFGLPYADTQCGAKVFQAAVIQSVVPELTVTDMSFDVELLIRLQQHGYDITEIPTRWHETMESTFMPSTAAVVANAWRMFRSLIMLRLQL